MIPIPGMTKERWDDFLTYHHENMWIWQGFKAKALELRSSGRRHFGAKAIMESLRYEYCLANPDKDFKINNNYTSIYARVAAARVPELKEFFEVRELTAEREAA